MRFRDRPLLVDGLDAGLYLARPQLERRLVEPLAAGRNVLLVGEAGAGKSTLLRRTASLLAERNCPAVVVNAGVAGDAAGVLDMVAAALDAHLGAGPPTATAASAAGPPTATPAGPPTAATASTVRPPTATAASTAGSPTATTAGPPPTTTAGPPAATTASTAGPPPATATTAGPPPARTAGPPPATAAGPPSGGAPTAAGTGSADDAGPAAGPERLLRAVRRLRRDEPAAAILLDGLIDPDVAYDLFGRLRDELWALGHAWAVAVRPRDSAALRTPPADAFWSAVVEIPPLDDVQTASLLRLGLSPEELQAVERDRPIVATHPRYVIRAAQDVLERRGSAAEPPSAEEHLRRATALGRGEAMAVAELQGLARPVSVHDPELLDRLRWSRPYAQRILSNLEQHKILRSIPERSHRPGRPRKLYELDPNLPPQ